MSADNNPFAAADGKYGAAKVSFGAPAAAAAPATPAGELIKDTSTKDFPADVIKESRNQVVLVDFWAPWCGPCKQLTPVLEKVVREAAGRVKLVKMDIDAHPAIAGQLGIQSIPAVIAFRDGQPVDGFMGALPESQVREFIDKVAGPATAGAPPVEEALAAATQAVEMGDVQTASEIYAEILDLMPENVEAIAGLAGLLVGAGELDGARQLLSTAPQGKADHPAIAGVAAKIALADQVSKLGDPAEFERKLAENPKDHQARFDLAMVQNARGERDAAADSLLAIMRADRTWDEDGARRQLLLFFDAWGPADAATLSARRKLSSLLFS